ncbi:MAG: hypothetical protein DWI30_04645 [Chloroflexi bacterium]|nr:MAG: hypothetical protein DWI30_04645 [Chloroflexota bacterium]
MRQRIFVGLLVLALWWLTPLTPVVHAQSRVDIIARVGFVNTYSVDAVTPIQLTISGDDQDRSVVVEWVITNDTGSHVTWQRAITLAAQSSKQLTFNSVIPGYARSIMARVRADNQIIASTMINAEAAGSPLNVVVASDMNLLANLSSTPLPDGSTPLIRIITPDQFPSDVSSLQGIYTLFIDDPSLISPVQTKAIILWMNLGGRVVLAGNATGEWEPLAPIQIDTNKPLSAELLADMPKSWPKNIQLPAITPQPDAVALSERAPLLWSRSIGRGELFQSVVPFVATRGWDQQSWYWQPVVSPIYPTSMTTVGFPPAGSANDPLMYGINIPALNHPAPGLIFGLIVLYIIVIGPITYQILKRRNALDMAWVTIPIVAIVVTLSLAVTGWVVRGNNTLVYALTTIQQQSDATTAFAATSLGVYTPFRGNINVTSAPGTSLMPLYDNQNLPIGVVHEADDTNSASYTSDIGDVHYFQSTATIPAPVQLSHRLVYRNGSLDGDVTVTGMPLSDAVLLHGTFSQALGNVATSTPIKVHIDSNSSSFPCDAPNDSQATFNILRIYEQVAGPCGAVNALPENRVVLYGWSDVPIALANVRDHTVSAQRQLVIVTLTIPVTP